MLRKLVHLELDKWRDTCTSVGHEITELALFYPLRENSGCNINETYMKANAQALKDKGMYCIKNVIQMSIVPATVSYVSWTLTHSPRK